MDAVEILKQSALFSRFDDATLRRLAEPFSEVEFPATRVLIEPRMPGAGLFVISEGTVVVEAGGLRRELGPGEVVGEISLVDVDGSRRARVVAKTPVRCLALGRADFERMVAEQPELDAAVRELADRRLQELGEDT